MTALAPALQAYFTERLINQRSSSPETISAYRDAFRLLLRFASDLDRCVTSVVPAPEFC